MKRLWVALTAVVCAGAGAVVGAGLDAGTTVASSAVHGSVVSTPVTAGSSRGAEYAAFGDSYSAGEGTLAYYPGTAVPGVNVCHRSSLAYAPVLAARQPSLGALGFAACSGAVTADLFAPNSNGNRTPAGVLEPAQLCGDVATEAVAACGAAREPVIGPDTRNVTLTIGGNDVGFAHIVQDCIWVPVRDLPIGLPGRGCSRDPLVVAPALRRLAALSGIGTDVPSAYNTTIHPISAVLAAIHTAAPGAHVYIAGYPQLLQPQGDTDCVVGRVNDTVPVEMTAADAASLDSAAKALDASIAAAAARAGAWATYVDVTSRFAGHGLCTDSPWINPVTAKATVDLKTKMLVTVVDPGSVHPTVDGQAHGYADAYAAAGLDGR